MLVVADHPARLSADRAGEPGDLFDGGEIDQMLVLNILSLTDEEKEEMRAADPRTREILERTESLSRGGADAPARRDPRVRDGAAR